MQPTLNSEEAKKSSRILGNETHGPVPEYIHGRSILVKFSKSMLVDEKHVDQYLEKMREALLAKIRNGKRIQI
jgi:hypothetical protein